MAGASPSFVPLFGRPEGVLGRLGGVIMARLNRDAAAWVVGLLDIRPTDRILEIGFGPGVGIQLLAERASAGRVWRIDLSPEMVEQATVRNRDAIGSGRVQLQLGVADRLPFADASFDKAMAISSVYGSDRSGSGTRARGLPPTYRTRRRVDHGDREGWKQDRRGIHAPFETVEKRRGRDADRGRLHRPRPGREGSDFLLAGNETVGLARAS